jgi:hypothetical protein
MPVTVKVNGVFNSLVHKGSNGISIATIPDVCKTPSPGGPVPIPYPNISQSTMLDKGTTTVKADGGMMIAVKGSEFSMSNGDNAGVAGGVVSSTFMKESTWILYSFDVKMDGQNACRFMDKKFQNHQNTVDLAGTMQGPVVVIDLSKVALTQDEACKELDKNKIPKKDKDGKVIDHDAAAKRAGMKKEDYDEIKKFSAENDVTVSFRQTNPAGVGNIGNVPCKPGSCQQSTSAATGLTSGTPQYTGDYDMHDLMEAGRTVTNPARQAQLARRLNNLMDPGGQFPRVMHGPQSTFNAYLREHPEKITDRAKKYLAPGAKPGQPITAFDKGEAYQLESNEDVLNMYRCKGVAPPKHWDLRTAKGMKVRTL